MCSVRFAEFAFSLKYFWVTWTESFCSLSSLTDSKKCVPKHPVYLECPGNTYCDIYICQSFLSVDLVWWNRNDGQQCVASFFCRTACGVIPWRIRGCLISCSFGIFAHVLLTLFHELLNCHLFMSHEAVPVVWMLSVLSRHVFGGCFLRWGSMYKLPMVQQGSHSPILVGSRDNRKICKWLNSSYSLQKHTKFACCFKMQWISNRVYVSN